MPMPTKEEILERATDLYMKDQARLDGALGETTPEITELKEGGFWQQAIEELRSPDGAIAEQVVVDKDFLVWAEQAYGAYDDNMDREMMRTVAAANNDFLNCLVLSFPARHFKFAVDMLMARYKKNFMPLTNRILEANKKSGVPKIRVLWFVGTKEQTTKILDELREKHNLTPRVLRDSYLRRDFAHYNDGAIYKMPLKQFIHLREKQSVILNAEETQKIFTTATTATPTAATAATS